MKALEFVLAVVFCTLTLPLFGHGVLLTGENNDQFYRLLTSEISVDVEDQVAIVTSTQLFSNLYGDNTPKYVFPLPEGASATQLRWQINDKWFIASFAPVAQDSLPPNPSQGWPYVLQEYMGNTPLFFNFDNPVEAEQNILVEITYVMLLPYHLGNVTFDYPNRYSSLQFIPLESITLDYSLSSQRTIMSIDMPGFTPDITNDGHEAHLNLV
ncbi:MAG TPA: VIT domain-containing protein, partial [Candidatus Cloacimonadota bacterium]|nr:VIT domain-containing protein [Candidatus Cloacimonadota bacterium]